MMKRLTSAALITLLATTAQAENLLEIYQKAKLNDPAIREAEALMLADMEGKPQARADLLPQIDASANWQYARQEGDNTFPVFGGAGGSQTGEIEGRNRSYGWSVDLRQTLFNWDQWQQLERADRVASRAGIDFAAAQQELMLRVTEAYFEVLAAQDTLASERASKDAIGRQLEQAERRFEVGLIAVTDVKEAQAAFDDAVALEISAQRSLATSKEALREITGEYPQQLANPGDEFALIPPSPQIEQDWVDISMQQNLSLESAELGVEITREDIQIARGGYAPSLDFFAQYANNQGRGTNTSTVTNPNLAFDSPDDDGFLSRCPPGDVSPTCTTPSTTDRDIDQTSFGLQFSVPIFQGGGTSARVKEQVYRHRASRENYEKVARETERLTRDAYLGVIADIARVRALARSVESNRTALEATEAGYGVGTRTTVDVLDSRRALFGAETQYARAKYDYLINVIRLKQAAGTLNEDDIFELNTWLVREEALPETPGRDAPDINLPQQDVIKQPELNQPEGS